MGKRGRPRYPDVLTPREQDVLALVRECLTNAEIAERLAISPDTVKTHVSQILSKLGVGTREEAAAWTPAPGRGEWQKWRRWVAVGLGTAIVVGGLVVFGLLIAASSDEQAESVQATTGSGEAIASDATPTTTPIAATSETTPSPIGTPPLTGLPTELGTYLIDVTTSDSFQITDDIFSMDPAWNSVGTFAAFARRDSPDDAGMSYLTVFDATSGTTTDLYETNSWIRSPAWSPDGSRIAFGLQDQTDPSNQTGSVQMVDATGTKQEQLADIQGSTVDWVVEDLLIVSNLGGVYAIRPGDTLVRLADDGHFSVSPDHNWLAHQDSRGNGISLISLRRESLGDTTTVANVAWGPSWSPDSRFLAFTCVTHLCLFDVQGRQVAQLTDGPAYDYLPEWDIASEVIYFIREKDALDYSSNRVLRLQLSTGGLSITGFTGANLLARSPSSNYFYYFRHREEQPSTNDIYVTGFDNTGHVRLLEDVPFPDCAWSPDGNRVLCTHWAGGN